MSFLATGGVANLGKRECAGLPPLVRDANRVVSTAVGLERRQAHVVDKDVGDEQPRVAQVSPVSKTAI